MENGKAHGQFNLINPKTLTFKQRCHRQKIRESLEISKKNNKLSLFIKLIEKRNQHLPLKKYLTKEAKILWNHILDKYISCYDFELLFIIISITWSSKLLILVCNYDLVCRIYIMYRDIHLVCKMYIIYSLKAYNLIFTIFFVQPSIVESTVDTTTTFELLQPWE